MKNYLLLGLAGALLSGCGHKGSDAPLAFVPADTPYVVANLDVLDEKTFTSLLAQYDAELPTRMVQLKRFADSLATDDPNAARLLRAITSEFDGNTIETFADGAGIDLRGHSAVYGLGLSPVARYELTDPKAFEAFVDRLETAYGKRFDIAAVGDQTYRKHVFGKAGLQIVVAVVGKQAVAAILPADAAQPMLRLALGLDRPEKNIQDDGRLTALAKAKGYESLTVGQLDLTRMLSLAAGGEDPIFNALFKAYVEEHSVAVVLPGAQASQISPGCVVDAARIASRMPSISFGYTRFDARHQDVRMDVALADDISKAFSGMKVELPGLGQDGIAPFDASLAVPVTEVAMFWGAQASAVAEKPFTCSTFTFLNDVFAEVGHDVQQADKLLGGVRGIRVSLDAFAFEEMNLPGGQPTLSGRVVVASSHPSGLLEAVGMSSSALPGVVPGGKSVALPPYIGVFQGMPVWVAMSDKAVAVAGGKGEDAKLAETLNAPIGDAGRLFRIHLDGEMYMNWVSAMEKLSERLGEPKDPSDDNDVTEGDAVAELAKKKISVESLKSAFDSILEQARHINGLGAEIHVEEGGLVVNATTELK